MPLQSLWFKANTRLQQCLTSDPAHVPPGSQGDHVLLIQEALMLQDQANIDSPERERCFYGKTTARAVKAYKTKRRIVNYSYETAADDIVGRMTIQRLDDEMMNQQQSLLLAANIRLTTPKVVVLSEPVPPWKTWSKQFAEADPATRSSITVPARSSPAATAKLIEQAASRAGNGGMIILSVGHGETLGMDEGSFELAPGGTFRVGGRNGILPGDNVPKELAHGRVEVQVFYDMRIPRPELKGGFQPSRKDEDEASQTPNAKVRLDNWNQYERVGTAFRNAKLSSILLLSCRIGGSGGILQRVAQQWGTRVIAYRKRVICEGNAIRARVYEDGDPEGSGTNTVWGEVMFPVSRNMVDFKP